MPNLPDGPDETPTSIFNPDFKDFEYQYNSEKFSIPAQEITVLPKYLADHVAKKLAYMLVWKRGIKTNFELENKNVLEEIYV